MKVIVDLPEYAERAAKSGIESVGLTRIEGIITSFSKHPLYYEKNNELDKYRDLLAEGIGKIVKPFNKIWIRASDIRTDEYSSLEGAPEREINPMLGFHGVRFSLKHPDILKAEFAAIRKVADASPEKKIGIMFPQIISIEEVRECKKYFEEIKTDNMEFGVMIETPASVQIIEDICEEVEFISFGTNDLTQFTLAVDRGEDNVQYLYDELHPAIFSQIKKVILACKAKGVETSICGQAGSKPEMVKFLVQVGIDSISVNADAAFDIAELINRIAKDREVEDNKVDIVQESEVVDINDNKINFEESPKADDDIKEVSEFSRVEEDNIKIENEISENREIVEAKIGEVKVSDSDIKTDSDEVRKERKRLKNRERRRKKKEKIRQLKEKSKWDKKGMVDMVIGAIKHESIDESNEEVLDDRGKINEVDSKREIIDREAMSNDNGFLDKSKIELGAERTGIDKEDFEPNIGPIEPFNDLSRVKREGEEISDMVEEDNDRLLEERARAEDKIEISVEEVNIEDERKDKLKSELGEVLDRSEGKDFENEVNNIGDIEKRDNVEDSEKRFDSEDTGVYAPKEEEKKNEYNYDFDDF